MPLEDKESWIINFVFFFFFLFFFTYMLYLYSESAFPMSSSTLTRERNVFHGGIEEKAVCYLFYQYGTARV